MGPTQPPIPHIPGSFFLEVEHPHHEAYMSLHFVSRSRYEWESTSTHILTFTVSIGISFSPLNFTINLYFLYAVFTTLNVSKLIPNCVPQTISKNFKIKITHSFRHVNGFWSIGSLVVDRLKVKCTLDRGLPLFIARSWHCVRWWP